MRQLAEGKRRTENRRGALWARVSSDRQANENQILALERKAEDLGIEIVKRYITTASAWNYEHSVLRTQALNDARAGVYGILLFTALDRITRGGSEDALRQVRKFTQDAGVRMISLHEPWLAEVDPGSADLLIAVFGWKAQHEIEENRRRIKEGMERARSQDIHVGRPKGAVDKVQRKREGYVKREENRPGGRWCDMKLMELEDKARELKAEGKRPSGAHAQAIHDARVRAGLDPSDKRGARKRMRQAQGNEKRRQTLRVQARAARAAARAAERAEVRAGMADPARHSLQGTRPVRVPRVPD